MSSSESESDAYLNSAPFKKRKVREDDSLSALLHHSESQFSATSNLDLDGLSFSPMDADEEAAASFIAESQVANSEVDDIHQKATCDYFSDSSANIDDESTDLAESVDLAQPTHPTSGYEAGDILADFSKTTDIRAIFAAGVGL